MGIRKDARIKFRGCLCWGYYLGRVLRNPNIIRVSRNTYFYSVLKSKLKMQVKLLRLRRHFQRFTTPTTFSLKYFKMANNFAPVKLFSVSLSGFWNGQINYVLLTCEILGKKTKLLLRHTGISMHMQRTITAQSRSKVITRIFF